MLACPSVGCERPFVSARSENAPGGIRTRDQRLSQSSDRTRKAVMLNRATPPERGPSGLLSFCALLSLEETEPAGFSKEVFDSSVISIPTKNFSASSYGCVDTST